MKTTAVAFLLSTCFVFGISVLSSQAHAQTPTPSELEQQIKQILFIRHVEDAQKRWQALDKSAVPVIQRMYAESNSNIQKLRLSEGLRFFKEDPATLPFYERELQNTQDALIKSSLITSYAMVRGEDSAAVLSPFLQDSDPQVRSAAAMALREMKNSDTQKMLKTWYTSEKEDWIKTKYRGQKADFRAMADETVAEAKDFSGKWKGSWTTAGGKNYPAVLEIVEREAKFSKATLEFSQNGRKQKIGLMISQMGGMEISGQAVRAKKAPADYRAKISAKDSRAELQLEIPAWKGVFTGTR